MLSRATLKSLSKCYKLGHFAESDWPIFNFRATPVLLAATALVYRTDEIIQALEP